MTVEDSVAVVSGWVGEAAVGRSWPCRVSSGCNDDTIYITVIPYGMDVVNTVRIDHYMS